MEKIAGNFYSWASILEENTRAQALTASGMPFIWPHYALMPDAHLGKGATVGSVIPTVGAIMPAAVGVDIGCTDKDTEYLSPLGWRKISEYNGDQVMQYDPETGTGGFIAPSAYIVKPCDQFYRLKTKYGIDQMLSPEHRVLFWKRAGRDRRQVMTVLEARDFAAEHNRLKQGIKGEFATTFRLKSGTQLTISDPMIRVRVMTNADAHVEPGGAAVLHLKKKRKIERAQKLLADAGITFTVHPAGGDAVNIRYRSPSAKSYRDFWCASASQLGVVADECLNWDGNRNDRCFYTRDRASADLIQYAFTANGYRAVLREDVDNSDGKTDYRVFANTNTMVGIAGAPEKKLIELVPSEDGKAYCFTVPTGFWVMRRGGNIVMTGNCGMIANRTSLTAEALADPELRHRIRERIEHAIPLSVGKQNQKLWSRRTERRVQSLSGMHGAADANQVANWDMQLGSLGSGNHFIEISLDEQDRVWLFLHSGSRGVGNKLAMRHIKIAQEQCKRNGITLPDQDLAYLVEGTDEFGDYIRDLRWAQHFALLNREEMMDRVEGCVSQELGTEWYVDERVNCHHNYTEEMPGQLVNMFERPESANGRVWLSRKGAIDASAGRPGLIPGSMGAASYVVEGRGDKMSLWSSPHGAGRNYSRGAAKRKFTMADLEARMTGRGTEWRHTDAFLDEHPLAYKDIDVVMKDAADLVEIKHTLYAIVNVKGD